MNGSRLEWIAVAALLGMVAVTIGQARADEKKSEEHMTPEELKYQAGSSPLAEQEMHQDINPKAPSMTAAEFERARQIYFERCAGYHAVQGNRLSQGVHQLRFARRHAELGHLG